MVYVHFAEGFEEVEAVTIVDLLRRAAIDVKTVSIMEDKMSVKDALDEAAKAGNEVLDEYYSENN